MPVACAQKILHHAHRHVRMVIVPDAVIGTILRTAVLKEEKHRTRKPVTGLPASAPGDSSFPENELNVFEYIMVLMTLVLGLGITENLKSITNLNLRYSPGESFTFLGYFIAIIILQLDYWHTIWLISDRTSWVLVDILIWFYLPVSLYLSGAFFKKALSMEGVQRDSAVRVAILVLFTWAITMSITGFLYFDIGLFEIRLLGPLIFLVACLSMRFFRIKPELYPLSSLGTLLFSVYFLIFIGADEIQ